MIQTTNETQIITKKERKHKMSETLYLVTGAAGFLGSHVCHQLFTVFGSKMDLSKRKWEI